MSLLAEIQEKLLDEDIILTIDADIILPRIGGYNARPYSFILKQYELPRPSEIKALWRWWLRVILSGVYKGQKTYRELDKKAGVILGNTQKQSLFSIIIKINDPGNVKQQLYKQKIKQFEQLLVNIVPEVLETFVKKYNSFKELKKISKLNKLELIPISIHFTNISSYLEFKQKIMEIFHIEPEFIRNKSKCRIKIKNSEELLELMKNLDITIDKRIKETVYLYDKLIELTRIPRIKLLKQPRKKESEESVFRPNKDNIKDNKYYKFLKRIVEELSPLVANPAEIPIRITIAMNNSRELNDSMIKFAVASLLLSLLLGGLGSIRNRGFGSIILRNVMPGSKYENLLKESIGRLNVILEAKDANNLKRGLITYINFVLNLADKVYGKNISYVFNQDLEMPKVPALLPNTDYFKLEVFECRKYNKYNEIVGVLEDIGKATLKVQWMRECGLYGKKARGELHTWILGLPRSDRNKGYFIISDEGDDKGRRPSAIIFKIFKIFATDNKRDQEQERYFVIVYGFLSRDWPLNRLIYKNSRFQRKKVDELGIRTPLRKKPIVLKNDKKEDKSEFLKYVFEAAFEYVTRIIDKECNGRRL